MGSTPPNNCSVKYVYLWTTSISHNDDWYFDFVAG